jgi:hypothetical protein
MVLHKVAKNTGARNAALRKGRKDFVEQMHPGDVLKAAPDAGRKAGRLRLYGFACVADRREPEGFAQWLIFRKF